MDDWKLSMLVWILIPALLIVLDMAISFNILVVILLFTWLGFGIFMVNPAPKEY